jgi:hypothetical protein
MFKCALIPQVSSTLQPPWWTLRRSLLNTFAPSLLARLFAFSLIYCYLLK